MEEQNHQRGDKITEARNRGVLGAYAPKYVANVPAPKRNNERGIILPALLRLSRVSHVMHLQKTYNKILKHQTSNKLEHQNE